MKTNQSGNDEMLKVLDNFIDGLDQQILKDLQRLQTIQHGRNSTFVSEQLRLEKKYGLKHPRVQKIIKRIEYNKGVAKDLRSEISKVNTPVPNYDPNTWIVYGQVIEDKSGNPVKGITVSLYTTSGTWVKSLGYSCTDEKGYYSIQYTKDTSMVVSEEGEIDSQNDQTKTRKSFCNKLRLWRETPPRNESNNTNDQNTFNKTTETSQIEEDFYLTLTDKDQNIIQTESQPVRVKPGEIDYRLIVLNNSQCSQPADSSKPESNDTPKKTQVKALRHWTVKGSVHYDDNSPADGVIVSFFDKERTYEECLGSVTTDKNGKFKAEYNEKDIRSLFDDKPDLFVKVMDKQGNKLLQSRNSIKSAEKSKVLKIPVRKPYRSQ